MMNHQDLLKKMVENEAFSGLDPANQETQLSVYSFLNKVIFDMIAANSSIKLQKNIATATKNKGNMMPSLLGRLGMMTVKSLGGEDLVKTVNNMSLDIPLQGVLQLQEDIQKKTVSNLAKEIMKIQNIPEKDKQIKSTIKNNINKLLSIAAPINDILDKPMSNQGISEAIGNASLNEKYRRDHNGAVVTPANNIRHAVGIYITHEDKNSIHSQSAYQHVNIKVTKEQNDIDNTSDITDNESESSLSENNSTLSSSSTYSSDSSSSRVSFVSLNRFTRYKRNNKIQQSIDKMHASQTIDSLLTQYEQVQNTIEQNKKPHKQDEWKLKSKMAFTLQHYRLLDKQLQHATLSEMTSMHRAAQDRQKHIMKQPKDDLHITKTLVNNLITKTKGLLSDANTLETIRDIQVSISSLICQLPNSYKTTIKNRIDPMIANQLLVVTTNHIPKAQQEAVAMENLSQTIIHDLSQRLQHSTEEKKSNMITHFQESKPNRSAIQRLWNACIGKTSPKIGFKDTHKDPLPNIQHRHKNSASSHHFHASPSKTLKHHDITGLQSPPSQPSIHKKR